ncbi:hypothetical protein C8034_v010479 [Colletotrichum sidae]|uniref:SGNH hydrolase-type esterase domain-containing protein n=1 Tax=Colletotrichum sidae TaxID=1347389 RepID=A0A4R8T301_9PEZI|nr:hypothetical protein C8034_v010479 [Colletotrichum sidae]
MSESSSTPSSENSPLKIMILGDEMTQGRAGTHTWRFRLHEWLRSEGVDFVFVGDFEGTDEYPEPQFHRPLYPGELDDDMNSTGEYAEEVEVPLRHCAARNMSLAFGGRVIQSLITDYEVDYLIIMVGFMDFASNQSTEAAAWDLLIEMLDNAYGVAKELRVAIATVPEALPRGEPTNYFIPNPDSPNSPIQNTAFSGARDDRTCLERIGSFNFRMREQLESRYKDETERDQNNEPVKRLRVVDLDQPDDCFDRQTQTTDGIHLNPIGEYVIAKAFSATLCEFGLGENKLVTPQFWL